MKIAVLFQVLQQLRLVKQTFMITLTTSPNTYAKCVGPLQAAPHNSLSTTLSICTNGTSIHMVIILLFINTITPLLARTMI